MPRKYTFIKRKKAPDYAAMVMSYIIAQPFKQRAMKAICSDLGLSSKNVVNATNELVELGVVSKRKETQLTIVKVL